MKKNLLIIICIFTGFIQAMEENFFSIVYYGTTINLTKGSIATIDGKTDIIVIGRNQQSSLYPPKNAWEPLPDCHIGTICTNKKIFYEKKQDYDSSSDDDTYQPYYVPRITNKQEERQGKSFQTTIETSIITITEPCFTILEIKEEYTYKFPTALMYSSTTEQYEVYRYIDDYGLEKASEGLANCYTLVLNKCLQENKQNIALSALSTETGFHRERAAPIAITTILQFIKKNMLKFKCIDLFVKKRSEYLLYEKLLMEQYKPIQVACLLYCAHTQKNGSFLDIPREIIDHIILFMFNG